MATTEKEQETGTNAVSRRPHRFVIMNGALYQLSPTNYRKALEAARDAKGTDFSIDPDLYRMVQVETAPLPDWSTLSSAEAEALLLGMPAEQAGAAERAQEEISGEARPGALAKEIIEGYMKDGAGEGEESEAEEIGQDEFQDNPSPKR